MAKLQSLAAYVRKTTERCRNKFGDDFVTDNEDLIEACARNKRLLDRFDDELDKADLTTIVVGSMGQQKEDINPIIKHRNDIAKLYADNLDALMLTPRAKYKKTEAGGRLDDDNTIADYFKTINNKES